MFLAVYALLAISYIHETPYRKSGCLLTRFSNERQQDIGAPDERQHTNYIRHLAKERAFPVFRPGSVDLYETYQSHQPPLYYLLATPIEMAVSGNETAEKWGLRLLNVFLGGLVILGIYWGIKRFTGNEHVALFSAGFTGLLPMFLALSAAVTNDMLLFVLVVASMNVIAVGWDKGWSLRQCLLAGLVLGLGLLTKSTAVLLFPVLLTAFLLRKDKRPALWHAAATFALAILIALPWLIRNQQLYGDPLAIGAFQQASVGNLPYAEAVTRAGGTLSYWFSYVFVLGLQGFWGVFGYFDVFMPPPVYWVLGFIGLAALVGFLLRWSKADAGEKQVHWLTLALIACVSAGFISYNLSYFQAQGRYLYPAIFALASLAGFGVWGLAGGNVRRFWTFGGAWLGLLFVLDMYVAQWLLPIAFSAMENCQ
ncbi:MAG: glycosyltransferase family 39 protein [Armatimonadetes bacterium]|nr:glycosyltransferase family 39 protein [Armatimonadota bacterium]